MLTQEALDKVNLYMKKGFWAEAIEMVSACPDLAKYRYPDNGGNVLCDAVCYDGAHELVARLLELGADPNGQNSYDATAIGNAIHSGHRHGLDNFENIRLLVAAGADLRLFDETGKPPLQSAVDQARRDVVELLLKAGADPYQKNLYGDDVWQYMDWLKDWRMKDLFPPKDGASDE